MSSEAGWIAALIGTPTLGKVCKIFKKLKLGLDLDGIRTAAADGKRPGWLAGPLFPSLTRL